MASTIGCVSTYQDGKFRLNNLVMGDRFVVFSQFLLNFKVRSRCSLKLPVKFQSPHLNQMSFHQFVSQPFPQLLCLSISFDVSTSNISSV